MIMMIGESRILLFDMRTADWLSSGQDFKYYSPLVRMQFSPESCSIRARCLESFFTKLIKRIARAGSMPSVTVLSTVAMRRISTVLFQRRCQRDCSSS